MIQLKSFLISLSLGTIGYAIYMVVRNQRQQSSNGPDRPATPVRQKVDAPEDLSFKCYPSVTEETCSICLSSGCDLKLNCGHSFHISCVSIWLNKVKGNCPYCRAKVLKPSNTYFPSVICLSCRQSFKYVKERFSSKSEDRCPACRAKLTFFCRKCNGKHIYFAS